jgi:hypothetical protein
MPVPLVVCMKTYSWLNRNRILSTSRHQLRFLTLLLMAVTQRSISLFTQKAQVIDTTISIAESSAGVPTGITMQPGDELALSAYGTIWAGVWFTGVNGPDGWTDRIETNPASPYINQPDAHPFCLVGRFDNDPWFYVGSGFTRRPATVTGPKQLTLRTNDNTPGNGAGSFQCRVQVWR